MIIKDPVLGDYFIIVDDNNYALVKDSKKVDAKNQPIYYPVGYYSTLNGALRKVTTLLVARKTELANKKVLTIREYMNEIKATIKELKVAMQNW